MSAKFDQLFTDIQSMANPQKANVLKRYFKTGVGQYGQGDTFLGLMTPISRALAKKYFDLTLGDLHTLLQSDVHEHRSIALSILKIQFLASASQDKKSFVDFYLNHTTRINNWDLVDISAPAILGDYLLTKDRSILYQLAASASLWERRIAIIPTLAFIKKYQFDDTLAISRLLFSDTHDLIHKATGWMLREVGKRSLPTLTEYLDLYCLELPRTSLRYAIERLSASKRAYYLNLR